ncbi:hypothetical protein ES708_34942 [subsurface metagenome]
MPDDMSNVPGPMEEKEEKHEYEDDYKWDQAMPEVWRVWRADRISTRARDRSYLTTISMPGLPLYLVSNHPDR